MKTCRSENIYDQYLNTTQTEGKTIPTCLRIPQTPTQKPTTENGTFPISRNGRAGNQRPCEQQHAPQSPPLSVFSSPCRIVACLHRQAFTALMFIE